MEWNLHDIVNYQKPTSRHYQQPKGQIYSSSSSLSSFPNLKPGKLLKTFIFHITHLGLLKNRIFLSFVWLNPLLPPLDIQFSIGFDFHSYSQTSTGSYIVKSYVFCFRKESFPTLLMNSKFLHKKIKAVLVFGELLTPENSSAIQI